MEDGGIGKRKAKSGKRKAESGKNKGVSLLGLSDGGSVGDFGFLMFD